MFQLKDISIDIVSISDTGWKLNQERSNTRRGIYDYDRCIEFIRSLDAEELNLIKKLLKEDPKCPGYSKISAHIVDGNMNKYCFSVTMDSSD